MVDDRMDLERMLSRCTREQWSVDDLNWDAAPRALGKDDEIAVVQYFTDMAGIELLAAELFEEQRRIVDDPTLKGIFESFVIDERRHAKAANLLAEYYDVHHYREYKKNPDLERFAPHFVAAIRFLSAEIANVYITCGELILDVALLRSLNDFVNDGMSKQAMRLINRDESRHIAIDFHMCEFYASDAWQEQCAKQPRKPIGDRAKALWAFGNVLYHAAPFFKHVFFEPMELTDPSGRRLREAFKRIQLIATRPKVKDRPFVKFMSSMRGAYNNPALRSVLGPFIERLTGMEPEVLETLYTHAEESRTQRMSWDEMAEEALSAKLA